MQQLIDTQQQKCEHFTTTYLGSSRWKCNDCGLIWIEHQIPEWLANERDLFQQGSQQKVFCDEDAIFIVKKLARYFKLGKIFVNFYGYKGGASAYVGWNNKITFSHIPTVLTIAHEVTHFLVKKKWERSLRYGSRKWMTQLKRVIKYDNKKS